MTYKEIKKKVDKILGNTIHKDDELIDPNVFGGLSKKEFEDLYTVTELYTVPPIINGNGTAAGKSGPIPASKFNVSFGSYTPYTTGYAVISPSFTFVNPSMSVSPGWINASSGSVLPYSEEVFGPSFEKEEVHPEFKVIVDYDKIESKPK